MIRFPIFEKGKYIVELLIRDDGCYIVRRDLTGSAYTWRSADTTQLRTWRGTLAQKFGP